MKPSICSSSSCRSQRGVAMLEVLIAFFVLSIGLLGLAGLQMKALQFNQSAFQQSQAMVSVYDMLDRMRMNRDAATGGSYNTGGWGGSHSAGNLVDNDLNAWLVSVSGNLPDGQGSVNCDANLICTVEVRWTNRFNVNNDPDEVYETVSMSSQM
ncbi:MAG TPA: type IV pilus modification protein PilV [Pseudomonadales bacterium]|nr:type IV pilus modification protein PilV [Pseudomonadales bacterium]